MSQFVAQGPPNFDLLGRDYCLRLKYLLVAIAKRRLHLPQSLWEILQIVSIASMEQIAIPELLAAIDTRNDHVDISKQLEINYS